ncbi:hypothetical protein WDU94_000802 [Cyamophila willieti]
MPSMATSHGGTLYYVVKVPKDQAEVMIPSQHQGQETTPEKWTTQHKYLEERHYTPFTTSTYKRNSTDSGWDNPFRPDGDLSKEADEIVQLIKGGKPITPTQQQNGLTVTLNGASPIKEEIDSKSTSTPLSKTQNGKSSSTPSSVKKPSSPGQVQVEHGTVDASQVEHVVLKKKPKCKCCTIQ